MVTPDAKRKAVAHACTVHAVSQHRACLALTIDRSTVRYTSTRPDDGLLREAMKVVAAERRRFGYRRIHIMLDREGIVMNQKKLRRLYREEKLQVRRRGGRKRALGTRRPMLVPDRANTRWSLDFLSDTISDGRRFRVLAIVDDYTRECLALVADTSLSGLRVARELDGVIRLRGRPGTIVSDNGTEFTSMAILRWCQETGVEWHYIAPGKPTQNAFVESFNGRFRRVPQRHAVLDVRRGPQRHHLMEGGLQPPQTPLGPRQHHARRVRTKIHAGKTGRLKPETKPRTLPQTGGEMGLRSLPTALPPLCGLSGNPESYQPSLPLRKESPGSCRTQARANGRLGSLSPRPLL